MRIIAAHIEGLGKIDGTGQQNGYLFTTQIPDGFDQTLDSYDWKPIMGSEPTPGTTRVEPYEPTFRFAPFDLKFSAGRTQDFIAELMLYKQTSATTSLAEDVAVGDTSFDVDDASDIATDDVIYVGGETMKVGSKSGNTIFVIGQRGWYGSEEATHLSGASVYKRPPFFEGRRVVLYTYDTEDGSSFDTASEARARGVIDGAVTMDKATMTVPVRQILAPLSRAKLNRDPKTPNAYTLRRYTFGEDSPIYPGESLYSGPILMSNSQSGVRKRLDSANNTFFFEIDEELYLTGTGYPARLQPNGPITQGPNDTLHTSEPARLDREPIEVFVAGQKLGFRDGTVTSSVNAFEDMPSSFTVGGTTFNLTTSQQASYTHHRLAIACALLFSGPSEIPTPEEFDILQYPNFGADLSFLFSDEAKATAHSLILDAQGQSQQIDQLVLGESGDPVELLEVIQKRLLHPFYKIGVDKNGKLNFYRSGLPSVSDYDAARANKLSPLSGMDVAYVVDNGQGSTTDIIEAKLGGTPYVRGRTVTLKADTGQPDRPYILKGDADTSLDLSTIDSQSGLNRAVEIVTDQALLQHFASKRIRVSVQDWQETGADYGLGEYVTLDGIGINDAWLVDKNGDRVAAISNDVEWVGQIISRTPHEGFAGYDLELLFSSNDIIRNRAPSGVVASYDSGTKTITLDADVFHNDGDGSKFNSGDAIEIVDTSGTVIEENSVDSTTDDTITVVDTFTTAPVDGNYVRLSDYDSYSNTGLSTNVALIYVYLADVDATLGAADDDAHIYGI